MAAARSKLAAGGHPRAGGRIVNLDRVQILLAVGAAEQMICSQTTASDIAGNCDHVVETRAKTLQLSGIAALPAVAVIVCPGQQRLGSLPPPG